MKRFRCVIEYESANSGLIEILRYEKMFPSNGVVKIYHPVDKIDVLVNGKISTGKRVKILVGSRVEVQCVGTVFLHNSKLSRSFPKIDMKNRNIRKWLSLCQILQRWKAPEQRCSYN